VRFAEEGLPAEVVKVADAGRYRIVETRVAGHPVRLLHPEGESIPADPRVAFDPDRTFFYSDGWIAGEDHP